MDSLSHFRTIEEMVRVLDKEHRLLGEMFTKRKVLNFSEELALELVGQDEARIRRLLDYGVIVENGNMLEIGSDYRNFFEEVLNVNEQISILSVQECINTLREYIGYFLQENNENRRHTYLDSVRQVLRKTGFRTLRNVVDLKRNIDDTYKQEPNYLIKKQKLKNLDEKIEGIKAMIRECERLMDTEQAFFVMANDPHMARTCSDVRHDFVEAYHALLEIDRQIIVYLNQIERQNQLYKKVRRLKYLQDQLTLTEVTNVKAVLGSLDPLWMEPKTIRRIRLSIDELRQNDNLTAILRKVASRNGIRQVARTEADPLSDEDLQPLTSESDDVNPTEVWNAFAASGYSLFDFLRQYDYKQVRTLADHATLFCQLIIMHPDECRITSKTATFEDLEYPIVYAKQHSADL